MSNENGIENQGRKAASIKLSPRQERGLKQVLSNQKYRVINVAEIIARDNVSGVMDRMDMCTCQRCTCDVLAIALNALPTKYVTTDAGKQYIQLQTYKRQFETDVEIALMKACLIVKESPKHDEPEED